MTRRNLTLNQRHCIMLRDRCVLALGPIKVRCRGCESYISLDKRGDYEYYPSNWEKHKRRCVKLRQLKGITKEDITKLPDLSLEELDQDPIELRTQFNIPFIPKEELLSDARQALRPRQSSLETIRPSDSAKQTPSICFFVASQPESSLASTSSCAQDQDVPQAPVSAQSSYIGMAISSTSHPKSTELFFSATSPAIPNTFTFTTSGEFYDALFRAAVALGDIQE
ncbi:hypothetical protein K435DRAFT_55350 [Dendrothele bispora CBS 962.96]|uniref:Uncharacterized protein n=1 Tax=Dendrothele bispora (strain CBS 962.96) TaxID=1314807 RepID=A0A4S8KRR7_DENBC|nr:hypothetical protein K435DRAFT_55350 [Dendrothele bispora CBS 962.96]